MGAPLAVVYRGLAHLQGAGIAWPEALSRAAGRDDPRWWAAGDAVARGASLGTALAPLVPPLDLAAIRAGEVSGRMEEVLRRLADRHDETTRVERARKGALAYPIVVAHVAAALLPIPDLVAGRTGAALLWAAAVLVPLYAYLALARAARRAAERGEETAARPLDRFLRSRASVEEADARALSALGWLHDAGVAPLEALPLAASAGAGGRAARDFRDALEAVKAGRPISSGLSRVPTDVARAVENGETAGRLSEACLRAAASLETSAAYRRERTLALLKPLTILVLGLVIGVRVIFFYVDMYRRAGVM